MKQGGVISPVLFCIYIDDLLKRLSASGVGCCLGSNFVGALAYADDIVLVARLPLRCEKCLCYVICTHYNTTYFQCTEMLPVKNLTLSFAPVTSISCNRGITLLSVYIFPVIWRFI